jgi:hypothetical protein
MIALKAQSLGRLPLFSQNFPYTVIWQRLSLPPPLELTVSPSALTATVDQRLLLHSLMTPGDKIVRAYF